MITTNLFSNQTLLLSNGMQRMLAMVTGNLFHALYDKKICLSGVILSQSESESSDDLGIFTVIGVTPQPLGFVDIEVNDKQVKFELDTGADARLQHWSIKISTNTFVIIFYQTQEYFNVGCII